MKNQGLVLLKAASRGVFFDHLGAHSIFNEHDTFLLQVSRTLDGCELLLNSGETAYFNPEDILKICS